ncbi:MAG: NTP transferase domain-containing protein [Planctomycetes bacterium]|nr:NTP transferase domain-containing protein [Planctomycetota bacterium]
MPTLLGSTPVVILAGGLGTRLRMVLPNQPKGLAPIGDQSFLEIQIQLLRDQGARHFVLCVGYQADQIQAALGTGQAWDIRIDYSVEGDKLLGTAGALKRAERFFQPRALVLNGDTFFAVDYGQFLQHHLEEQARSGALATLALAQARDQGRYGNVVLDSSQRYLAQFREKDASRTTGWLSAGAYVLEKDLLQFVPPDQPCSLEQEVLPAVLQAGRKVAAWTADRFFFDIGTPDGLRTFTQYYGEWRHGCRSHIDRGTHPGEHRRQAADGPGAGGPHRAD